MASAKIDIVSLSDAPVIIDIYNQMFRPTRDVEFIRRRYLGRYNELMLIASLDERPVGFFLGFELKPSVYFSWLFGVLPEFRRVGIATQLMDAVHLWVAEHGYASIRVECQNQHRPILHMAIDQGYDVTGIRWDPDRGHNLVIFEKSLGEREIDE